MKRTLLDCSISSAKERFYKESIENLDRFFRDVTEIGCVEYDGDLIYLSSPRYDYELNKVIMTLNIRFHERLCRFIPNFSLEFIDCKEIPYIGSTLILKEVE